jgi:hypothetical protein
MDCRIKPGNDKIGKTRSRWKVMSRRSSIGGTRSIGEAIAKALPGRLQRCQLQPGNDEPPKN